MKEKEDIKVKVEEGRRGSQRRSDIIEETWWDGRVAC